jgi:hypothetical protein
MGVHGVSADSIEKGKSLPTSAPLRSWDPPQRESPSPMQELFVGFGIWLVLLRAGLCAFVRSRTRLLAHRKRVFATTLMVGIAITCAASADNFITAGNLRNSITYLPIKAFAPLRIVEVTIRQPTSSIQLDFVRPVRFFQLPKFTSQPLGPRFWRAIPVYKGGRHVDVALIDSPDCSVETIALHGYQNSFVDLLVSKRHPNKSNPFPPENTPVPQEVEVFRLTRTADPTHSYPPIFFKWIRSQFLSDPVCTEADVAWELGKIPP